MSELPRINNLNPGNVGDTSGLVNSMLSCGLGDLDSEQGVVLRDWSARDFANIYVKFRPHLINHARKFLREHSQAEEVVQDAFLYLMTALPELDSELGVLRFLKWKTKMLCMDVGRHSQSGLNPRLVPLTEDIGYESRHVDSLERADDAAVIQLALARLSPRHREALIATIYEEKTHEEVAQQMGLGPNAFRQLLFRARASFRTALVGEAEIDGKSVSEIISIAARKNAKISARVLGGTGAWVLVAGLFSLLNSVSPESANIASQSNFTQDTPAFQRKHGPILEVDGELGQGQSGDFSFPVEEPLAFLEQPLESASVTAVSMDSLEEATNVGTIFSDLTSIRSSFAANLDVDFAEAMARDSNLTQKAFSLEQRTLVIESGPELTAYLALGSMTEGLIQYVSLIYVSDLGELTLVPTNSLVTVEKDSKGATTINYVATDFLIGDMGGAFGNVAVDDAPMRKSALSVRLVLSPAGLVEEADFSLVPRA